MWPRAVQCDRHTLAAIYFDYRWSAAVSRRSHLTGEVTALFGARQTRTEYVCGGARSLALTPFRRNVDILNAFCALTRSMQAHKLSTTGSGDMSRSCFGRVVPKNSLSNVTSLRASSIASKGHPAARVGAQVKPCGPAGINH
jgi:hypothetical protein